MANFNIPLSKIHSLLKDKNKHEDSKISIYQLPGDASTRRYYRAINKEDFSTAILMQMDPYVRDSNTFLQVQSLLQQRNISVPEVFAEESTSGCLLLQDLGDRTMLHSLKASMDAQTELGYFHKAIDLLLKIHSITPTNEELSRVKGFSLAFDEEILNWEINFTFDFFYSKYLKRNIPEGDLAIMKNSFADINHRLAREPRVFTHRDFHSRNIMIGNEDTYYSIDFQDARMGLRQYDLASILRDSYYQLTEDKVYALLSYYMDEMEKQGSPKVHFDHFTSVFDLMSIQRNFKAIGSFASFFIRRENASYLRFIGNTFENIRRNLSKFPEYKELHQLLFNWYYF